MSIYATLDGDLMGQIATVTGYGAFQAWVASLEGDYPDLAHLAAHGWDEDLDQVAKQLQAALKESPPEKYTLRVAKSMAAIVGRRGDRTVLTVTDGMVTDDSEGATAAVDGEQGGS